MSAASPPTSAASSPVRLAVTRGLGQLNKKRYGDAVRSLADALRIAEQPDEAGDLARAILDRLAADGGRSRSGKLTPLLAAVLDERRAAACVIALALQEGRFALARDWCLELVRRAPDDPDALYLQSRVFEHEAPPEETATAGAPAAETGDAGLAAQIAAVLQAGTVPFTIPEPELQAAEAPAAAEKLPVEKGGGQSGPGARALDAGSLEQPELNAPQAGQAGGLPTIGFIDREAYWRTKLGFEEEEEEHGQAPVQISAADADLLSQIQSTLAEGAEGPAGSAGAATKPAPEDDAAAYLYRARARAAAGERDGALAEYTAALARYPDLAAAHNERGVIYELQGNTAQALQDYDAAVRLEPDNAVAHRNRADARCALGQTAEALDDYSQAISLNPMYVEAYVARGLAYVTRQEYTLAQRDYEQALWLDPNSVAAHGQRGDLQMLLGYRYTQESDVERGRESYLQAIEDYTAAATLAPDRPWGFLNRARARTALGEAEQALADYALALALDPKLAAAYAERAALYAAQGRFDEALAEYDRAGAIDPKSPDAYLGRAQVLMEQGSYSAALQEYEYTIALAPGRADAHAGRADALAALGDHSAAVWDYTQAIKLAPGSGTAHRGRAFAQINIGDAYRDRRQFALMRESYLAALADCEEAVRLMPDDPWSHQYHGLALRALDAFDRALQAFSQALASPGAEDAALGAALLCEQGETLRLWGQGLGATAKSEEALQALAQAQAADQAGAHTAWIRSARGATLLELGRFADAVTALEPAAQCEPADGWACLNLGLAHACLGQHAQARAVFERLLGLAVDHAVFDPWAHVGRGLALESLGEHEAAQQAFAQALPAKPGADAYLARAETLDFFRAYPLAERDRLEAVRLAPDSAEALNGLAWMYVSRLPTPENLAAAVAHAEKAVALEREAHGGALANYLDTLGMACLKLGRRGEAVEHLAEAVALDPYSLLFREDRRLAEEGLAAQADREASAE